MLHFQDDVFGVVVCSPNSTEKTNLIGDVNIGRVNVSYVEDYIVLLIVSCIKSSVVTVVQTFLALFSSLLNIAKIYSYAQTTGNY